jgi:hypothetical protein
MRKHWDVDGGRGRLADIASRCCLPVIKPSGATIAAALLGQICFCARGDGKKAREEDGEKGASAMPEVSVLGGDGGRGQELQGWVKTQREGRYGLYHSNLKSKRNTDTLGERQSSGRDRWQLAWFA